MNYEQLLQPQNPFLFFEKESAYITELHIQALWYEQKYFKQLATSNNQTIEVISPGIWNLEAGPDFKKAHILIDGKTYIGDVEIHLLDSSWIYHKHHHDPKYNDVILHLSLWPHNREQLLTSSGKALTMAYLEPSLTCSLAEILQMINPDDFPYKKFAGTGRCSSQLFKNMSEEEAATLLKSAAKWRLREKYRALVSIDSESSYLPGIAQALGYKNNAKHFLNFYRLIKKGKITSAKSIIAIGLHYFGFFDDKYQAKWELTEDYLNYYLYYKRYYDNICEPVKPDLANIRPYNHPIRRLILLAKLIENDDSLLATQLEFVWMEYWEKCNNDKMLRWLLEEMLLALPSIRDSFWNHHYLFGSPPGTEPIPLFGRDLKCVILINVFFPLLYESILRRGNSGEAERFETFYSLVPSQQTGKGIYMGYRLFGGTEMDNLMNREIIQQGAYQIHRDFCALYEASCIGCPFVERVRSLL